MTRRWPWLALATLGAAIALCIDSYDPQPVVDPAASRPIPAVHVPARDPREPGIRFFALGDTGTGGPGQRAVAEAMRAAAAAGGLDFVLLLGDNFYPAGVASAVEPCWDHLIVAPYESLGVPIHPCLGNHDHAGSVAAQIERSAIDDSWRMPAAYYTFSIQLGERAVAQFFALDTELLKDESEEGNAQLYWLIRALQESAATWKIVFGHHPLYSGGEKGDGEHMKQRVETVLVESRVDLYLAGHDHSLQFFGPVDGVRYAIAGGGGGVDNAQHVEWREDVHFAATLGGFAAVRLAPHEAVVEFIRPDGKTQFATSWRKP